MENLSQNNIATKPSPLENLSRPLGRVWVRSSLLRNKYLITGLCFIVWMLFIDRNDLPTQWKRVKELRTLQQSEKTMDQQISDTKQELELLKINPSTLEKYAREKYMMKKDNEDLYIISSAKQ